jgi:hypothetical protein
VPQPHPLFAPAPPLLQGGVARETLAAIPRDV